MAHRQLNIFLSRNSSSPSLWWPGIRRRTFEPLYYSLFCIRGPQKHASFVACSSDSGVLTGPRRTTRRIVMVIVAESTEIWIVNGIPAIRYVINWINCLMQWSWALSTGSAYKVNGAFHNAIESSWKYCLQLCSSAFQMVLPIHVE